MPNLEFPDYPSVTQVLGPYSGFDAVRPDHLAAASQRGTDAHTPCLARAAGLFVSTISPEIQGYYDSFCKWQDSYVEKIIAVEPQLVDHDHKFTGCPDLILQMKGDEYLSIGDLKTSKAVGKTWCGQLAAYRHLADKAGYENIERVFSLRLKADGSPALADDYAYLERDFSAFLTALYAWMYFH